MSDAKTKASADVLADVHGLVSDLVAVYKDLHAHPELSIQEKRTAGLAAGCLRAAGYEVSTGIGCDDRGRSASGNQGLAIYRGFRACRDVVSVHSMPYRSKPADASKLSARQYTPGLMLIVRFFVGRLQVTRPMEPFHGISDGESQPSIDRERMMGRGIGSQDDGAPWGVERFGKTGSPSGIHDSCRMPFDSSA